MQPVLSGTEMAEADRRTIEEVGLPGVVLMENAGAALAQAIVDHHPGVRRPAFLCGKGGNGGDGFVAARRLIDREPTAYLLARRDEVRGDALVHLRAYEGSGGVLVEVPDAARWEDVRKSALEAPLLVDALLGTGLRQAPTGLFALVIQDLRAATSPIVAVDLPSGLGSESGEVAWDSVTASLTVTFAAPKYSHVLAPACERVGTLCVAPIGIPAALLASARLWLLEPADARRIYRSRPPGAHKGSFGHVLVVAGSVGRSGAAVLAATAALRAGAGLVTVATPADALPLVAALRAEIMTEPLPITAAGDLAPEALARALALCESRDAVVLGPGLGTHPATCDLIRELVARCPQSLVIDADGLSALAPIELLARTAPTVLLPHPGEAARLLGLPTSAVQARRLEAVQALAARSGAVAVLKGSRTLVCEPAGRAAVNPTGNPGMATAGTGDVLAGMVGALLARGTPAWDAAAAAVYLHGVAGDVAARRLGQEALLAGDLLDAIPEALRGLE